MIMLATAILMASLLGSLHCVGMCGPLAIWASGAAENASRRRTVAATALYHVGRLVTYLLMGLAAGAIGHLVDLGGDAVGIQVAAARVVGGLMIAFGLVRLWSLIPNRKKPVSEVVPSRIGGLLVRLRPTIFRLSLAGRALATGLLTTFLPCGWLYLFALVAAGTGSMLLGPVVMGAFWIGTVPALVSLVAGVRILSRQFAIAVPAAAALLLVATGCYTAMGRGFASIDTMADLQAAAKGPVDQLHKTTLPCCRVDKSIDRDVGSSFRASEEP